MKNPQKGLFITFEGIDGSGKTTQIKLLEQYLKEKGYRTCLTLEPGGTELGKKLREILLHNKGFVDDKCELFLYLADRSQHIEQINAKVKDNVVVLCDRHIDSTVAYQGYARGGDIEQINLLNDIATKGKKPDLTLLFDLDVELAQKRVGETKDRLEKEKKEFHTKVRQGFLELAKKYPERIKVIDSSRTKDEIFLDVKKFTEEIL